MDTRDLSAFVEVAERGSFSAAAAQLHLTQPAVSKRIANLEASIGHSLFDRVARMVMLTEAGKALLPHARGVLQQVEDGRRALSRLGGAVSGRLSIGTSHHIGLHRLPPVLRAFTASYSQVDLDIHFMDSEVACDEVMHGRLELGIVTLPTTAMPNLERRRIWDDPLVVVVARTHPLADVPGTTLAALAEHPAVLPDQATYTHRIVRTALLAAGITPHVRLATNYLETLKMLVAIGLGWSVLPQTLLDDSLVALDVPELRLQRELGVVWHARRTRSGPARALLAELGAAQPA
jgi:DNA-binding transcriptional LysR family regulator